MKAGHKAMTQVLETKTKRPQNDRNTPIKVCFVCSGNTCRSPMAAAVLNHLGAGRYKADSAGLCAAAGELISENSVVALHNFGIKSTPENDYENHRAVQADYAFLSQFDKIAAISKSHMMPLIMHFPELAEKITVMPEDIPDPFMQGQAVYTACLNKIVEGVKELFAL